MLSVKMLSENRKVSYPLLSDQDLKAHKIFNVLNTLDEQTMVRYRKFNLDIDTWSSRKHHTLAVPSLFLINEQLEVLWAHAAVDYKTRPTVEQVLKAVASVASRP